jgi:hypothetical protein
MNQEHRTRLGIIPEAYAAANLKIFQAVASLALAENPFVRRLIDLAIHDIKVEEIPASLLSSAILVSNYPSVPQTLRAVMKVACRIPGEEPRLMGIARQEIITRSNPVVGGFLQPLVLPATKDQNGKYSLAPKQAATALEHIKKGGVLWLSPTGSTEDNGLRVEDLRSGAVVFAQKTEAPIVPMGLITNQQGKITNVVFGDIIELPPMDKVSPFELEDYLADSSVLVLANIAALLPPGQRGKDLEEAEGIIEQTQIRLLRYSEK